MGHNGRNGYFLKGLLIGSVGGALAGLLLAPKSGKKLRSELKEKGSDVLEDTREFCQEAQKKACCAFEDTVDRLADVCEKTKKIFCRR
jgi:gas vesicle protein